MTHRNLGGGGGQCRESWSGHWESRAPRLLLNPCVNFGEFFPSLNLGLSISNVCEGDLEDILWDIFAKLSLFKKD